MVWEAVVYFCLGFTADWLIARYNVAIFSGQRLTASTLNFIIAVLQFFVLAEYVVSKSLLLLIAFGAGGSIGTYVALGKKHEKL